MTTTPGYPSLDKPTHEPGDLNGSLHMESNKVIYNFLGLSIT